MRTALAQRLGKNVRDWRATALNAPRFYALGAIVLRGPPHKAPPFRHPLCAWQAAPNERPGAFGLWGSAPEAPLPQGFRPIVSSLGSAPGAPLPPFARARRPHLGRRPLVSSWGSAPERPTPFACARGAPN